MVGIIHCTPYCNMSCRYCFEENWKENNVSVEQINNQFSEATDMFIQFAVDLCQGAPDERVDILLHGGEPLLVDIKKIERYFDYVSALCDNVRFIIQSNGTILSDEHIRVFKKYNICIGFSIDGPKDVHDYFRVDKNSKGTHTQIMKNYFAVKEAGIPIGALATFNGKNIDNIKNVYDFFSKQNIDFAFNPFFEPSHDDYSEIEFDFAKYNQSICELFDMWIQDEVNNISIRNFESIMDGLTNKEKSTHICSGTKNCAEEFIAIDLQGNIYTCNHFCGDKENSYAHFDEGSIYEIMEKKNPLRNRWSVLQKGKCNNCDIADLCHGGCPYHSLMNNGDINTPDNFCASNKIIIHHIYNYLKNTLSKEKTI